MLSRPIQTDVEAAAAAAAALFADGIKARGRVLCPRAFAVAALDRGALLRTSDVRDVCCVDREVARVALHHAAALVGATRIAINGRHFAYQVQR